MVAQYREGRKPAARKMRKHVIELRDAGAFPRYKVACKDNDIRRECPRAVERMNEIILIHVIADMQVADLRKRCTGELRREIGNTKRVVNEFEPVRLDLRGVSGKPAAREERCARSDESPAVQRLVVRRFARIIGPTTNGMCPMNCTHHFVPIVGGRCTIAGITISDMMSHIDNP